MMGEIPNHIGAKKQLLISELTLYKFTIYLALFYKLQDMPLSKHKNINLNVYILSFFSFD